MFRVLRPGGLALILDLRPDASPADIAAYVKGKRMGWLNALLTRWTFKHMLLKRAYTPQQFRQMAAQTPFGVRNLTIHISTDDSKALNDVKGPHVVISASGMASGGRILHHLHNNIGDPKATIVFAGFQSPVHLFPGQLASPQQALSPPVACERNFSAYRAA